MKCLLGAVIRCVLGIWVWWQRRWVSASVIISRCVYHDVVQSKNGHCLRILRIWCESFCWLLMSFFFEYCLWHCQASTYMIYFWPMSAGLFLDVQHFFSNSRSRMYFSHPSIMLQPQNTDYNGWLAYKNKSHCSIPCSSICVDPSSPLLNKESAQWGPRQMSDSSWRAYLKYSVNTKALFEISFKAINSNSIRAARMNLSKI